MLRRFMYVSIAILTLVLSFQFGAQFAQANRAVPVPNEVAVISGNVGVNDYVPLPVYADGTTALPSETHTIISLRNHRFRWPNGFCEYNLYCYLTEDRHAKLYGKSPPENNGSAHDGWSVNYLAIATRDVVIPVQQSTWGRVKSEFR